MTADFSDFWDAGNYKYGETTYVTDNPRYYIDNLESHFRESARVYHETVKRKSYALRLFDKHLDLAKEGIDSDNSRNNLRSKIRRIFCDAEKRGVVSLGDDWDVEHSRDRLAARLEFEKLVYKAQIINQGKLAGIIEGDIGIEDLDIVNYARPEIVVKISYDEATEGGSIRMRIFYDKDYDKDYSYGNSFAGYANKLDGINACCITEDNVNEAIPSPLDYVNNANRRLCRLKVADPVYRTFASDGKITYTIVLSEAEMAMLGHVDDGWRDIDSMCFYDRMWSPYLGKKLIWNLFGILGIEIEEIDGHDYFRRVFIPDPNKEPVKTAIEGDGVFRKDVSRESARVLEAVYDRTCELRSRCRNGSRFYPRFTVPEAARLSCLDLKPTKGYLDDLTGVLAKTLDRNRWKWFIPKKRFVLVEEILDLAENAT